jgi:hypothetical protein
MPRRETSGTGITQRTRLTYDLRNDGDLRAVQSMKFLDRIDGIERWARAIVKAHGLPDDGRFYTKQNGNWVPFNPPMRPGKVLRLSKIVEAEGHAEDSELGYAARCLEIIDLELKPAVKRDDAKAAATAGLTLGLLLKEYYIKRHWEKPALAGDRSIRPGKENLARENEKRKYRAEQRNARLQARANEIRKNNPKLKTDSAVARKLMRENPGLSLSFGTLRKLIAKPK